MFYGQDWQTGTRKISLSLGYRNQRFEENLKIFSLIEWAMLPCSARSVWVLVVVLLGALVRSAVSLAQAGFVDPSFLSGMTGPNSWLWAGALQWDGNLLLGGQFTSFNGLWRG